MEARLDDKVSVFKLILANDLTIFNVCRKTTFSQARRFEDAKAIYGPRMANFSLIDINDYFKRYNGAPKLDKFSFRKDMY